MSDSSKAVVRAFVNAINEQNWAALQALVASDFVRHSAAAGQPGVRSLEQFMDYLRHEYEVFPDAHETLMDLFAEGDRVAARHQFCGTQEGAMGEYPASGRQLRADYLAIYRIEHGRVAEAWAEWDNLSGLRQLGHLD